MLIEIKTYFSDGTISHDLVNCDKPNDWDNKLHIIGNYEKMCRFYAKAFGEFKIVKIEKKVVLNGKTTLKNGATRISWCSGPKYPHSKNWYEA